MHSTATETTLPTAKKWAKYYKYWALCTDFLYPCSQPHCYLVYEMINCTWHIPLINPKGNQSWIFIGRIDAEAETPILWPLDVKNWLIRRDSDAGQDWRQEEKGTTEDEVVGWHHWLDGPKFEQAPGVADGQGGLACCSPWGHKKSDRTEPLNWTEVCIWGQGRKHT